MSKTRREVHSEAGLNRRRFLGQCAGCALAAGCAAVVAPPTLAAARRATCKPKVRLVFSHVPSGQPTWPYISYDYEPRKLSLTEALTAACPEIEFVPTTLHSADEAKALVVKGEEGIHGYVCCMIGLWTGAPAALAATGKPTLYVDDLYAGSGEFLTVYSAAQRAKLPNVAGVASSRFEDVIAAAHCLADIVDPARAAAFGATCSAAVRARYAPPGEMRPAPEDAPPPFHVNDALAQLRAARILHVGGNVMGESLVGPIQKQLGPTLVPICYHELDSAYQAADRDAAHLIAENWARHAQAVVEPDAKTLFDSARMYLGMKSQMALHDCQAVTIDCLGGFYGGQMAAYPCLGFCQLNDDGLVGACEADIKSTLTMLAMTCLVGKPGFISDPVLDTSKNQIIYAHCVAPTKVDGPKGSRNPYLIRSHSEDRKGASLQSILPVGRMTTTIEIDPAQKAILFHQAEAVANVDEDKACRTKLAADVKGDIQKLTRYWDTWGWHRVTYYGDLAEPVHALAEAIGYTIVEEA